MKQHEVEHSSRPSCSSWFHPPMLAPTLHRITQSSRLYRKVMREDLRTGDWIIVRTESSEYRMRLLKNGMVYATGGWFDKKGFTPAIIGVAGATWGGSCYMPGVFAAVGLRLEFRNRVITGPVREIVIMKQYTGN